MIRKKRNSVIKKQVRIAIEILEGKVEPKYGIPKKYLITQKFIHDRPKDKYFKMFVRIIDFLEEKIGTNKNPLSKVLYDYYCLVLESYKKRGFAPNLFNISPSPTNKIMFEEWVFSYKRNYGENYWIKDIPKFEIFEAENTTDLEFNILEV